MSRNLNFKSFWRLDAIVSQASLCVFGNQNLFFEDFPHLFEETSSNSTLCALGCFAWRYAFLFQMSGGLVKKIVN